MQCTFTARCLNRDKDKITKTWIKIVIMQCTVPVHTKRCLNKDKDKISKTWCYNAKYVQQSFSIPTHIQNMDQMKLQFKEYTVLSKPH